MVALLRLPHRHRRPARCSRADLPLFRPDISQVATDRASVLRCRRSLPLADGRCCCCHRCCQLGVGRPVASRPAPCRGWPASGPGRLRPGPWFLTGVSAETPGSSDFACTFTRHFSPVLVALRVQPCLRLEGRTRTLSGPSPDPRAARTFVLSVCCVPSPCPISPSCTISSGILCRPGFHRGRSYVPDADPGGLGSLTSQNSSWLPVCRK